MLIESKESGREDLRVQPDAPPVMPFISRFAGPAVWFGPIDKLSKGKWLFSRERIVLLSKQRPPSDSDARGTAGAALF